MKSIEQYKKQFIRWYYGHFVNDPQAETFTFGLYRPFGAMRLSGALYFLQRNWKWMLAAFVAVLVLLIVLL